MLQGCICLSGVKTYLPGLCWRVQLFKRCRNLSANTVLQVCSCLTVSGPICRALCCRCAAVKMVSQPICPHCAAGVQLFKWCQNLPANFAAGVQLLKWCPNQSSGTVLQRRSCLSGVKTYLLALCCRGAAV